MNEKINTVGITIAEGEKFSSGIGYIALPKDIDRLTYLKDCFQNFRVSIHTAHDGFMNRVNISPDDINWLEFPSDYTKMGTAVYYIIDPIHNQPYIVKRFNSAGTLGTGRENQFKIGRIFSKSLVEISGDPNKGYLNLSVINDDNAEINIAVNNANDKGILNLAVKGSMNVTTSKETNFVSGGQFYSLVSDDKSESQTEILQTIKGIRSNTPFFSINNGKENFVLGQKFKSLLSDLLDKLSTAITEISSATVITMLGTQPLLNSLEISAYSDQIKALKDEIDTCLSEVGFIDK